MADQIVGLRLTVQREQVENPEVNRLLVDVLVSSTIQRVRDLGLEPVGDVAVLQPWWFRLEKEQHHKHGWQWAQVECLQAEASQALIVAEVRARG